MSASWSKARSRATSMSVVLSDTVLLEVGFGYFHAAILHPMLPVAAPEENQARLEFRFVRDECHVRLRPF